MMRTTAKARTLAVLLPLLLAGCAGAGDYRPPQLPVPPAWTAANAAPRSAPTPWWHDFADPALDQLIAAGLADNPDVAGALARLDQARAVARQTRAAQLPSAQAQGTIARQRQSVESGLGRLTRYVPTLSRVQNQGDIGISAGWDIDFAGGLAAQARGSSADAVAARAGVDVTRLAITAEIADAYMTWRNARADHALLLHERDLIAQQAQIVAARVARGDAAQRDSDDADELRDAITAALPDSQAAIATAQHRLAILTGRPAGATLPELAAVTDIAPLPVAAEPAAGTPADLLRARPDLVVAEARLRGSHARIGAALSEYWPKFSLSGLFGFSSNDLSLLGTGGANVITGAVGLRWRLFDFGRVDGEVAQARGAEREALAAYRGAVLSAGADVENAFVALAAARATLSARVAADAAAAAALDRIRASQHAGDISRIELVAGETRRIDSARALVAARTGLARALIGCHRALGG
ncbi:TolC family protein [Novosphingobium sp.]|uniref:TolC family protein n=1 Tax=Novosphingobium sp. TaxID=1874826 RepID=UPI00334277B7